MSTRPSLLAKTFGSGPEVHARRGEQRRPGSGCPTETVDTDRARQADCSTFRNQFKMSLGLHTLMIGSTLPRSSTVENSLSHVFLVGVPRSGTTWLQIMLGSHPNIATSRETHLFDIYLTGLFNRWEVEKVSADHDGLRVLLKQEEFFTLCKDFTNAVFERIASLTPGATVLLEKTPGHMFYYKNIRQLYPHCKFIHLIRDPRAVVASLLAASKEGWGKWAPDNVATAAKKWRNAIHFSQVELKNSLGEDYKEITYEQLVADVDKTLSPIWSWLGLSHIDIDPNIFSLDAIKSKSDQGPTYSPARENRNNFFRKGIVDGWRQELTSQDIEIIENICGDMMHQYLA